MPVLCVAAAGSVNHACCTKLIGVCWQLAGRGGALLRSPLFEGHDDDVLGDVLGDAYDVSNHQHAYLSTWWWYCVAALVRPGLSL